MIAVVKLRHRYLIAVSVSCCMSIAGCAPTSNLYTVEPTSRTRVASALHPAGFGYRLVHNFGSKSDGYFPSGSLIVVGNKLYGTTEFGGYGNNGTVFSITGSGVESVLHRFSGRDGAQPLAALLNVKGILYGATSAGGAHGFGTVFRLTTSKKEHVLHSFGAGGDGATPMAELIFFDGKLYGTTFSGGQYGGGTVFTVTTSGKESIIHSFGQGSDGSGPQGGLVARKGLLYGTTKNGGGPSKSGYGTIFDLNAKGTEKVIVAFTCLNGAHPTATMILVTGTLYGTTYQGGNGAGSGCTSGGDGVAFSLSDAETERTLYPFAAAPDGNNPDAALLSFKQQLYGTTAHAGTFGGGTIFGLTLAGKETVIHSFGYGADGNTPQAGVARLDRTFYGTTTAGGKYGGGTVYALNL